MTPGGLAALALGLALSIATPARAAREVRVPLRFEADFLLELVRRAVFSDVDGTAVLWDDGRECGRFTLAAPALEVRNERVWLTSSADGFAGTQLGDWCLFPQHWSGSLVFELAPELHAGGARVRLRLAGVERREDSASWLFRSRRLWDWIERFARPRFAGLALDLEPARAELGAVLPLFLQPGRDGPSAPRISLADAAVVADALVVGVRVEVDTPERSEPLEPEVELSPEEVLAFERALRDQDGFLTFVVREAAGGAADAELRAELGAVLLDARHRMVSALRDPERSGRDRVRVLFLRSWAQLAPLLRRVEVRFAGETRLRWVWFAAAGDALGALDALGPATRLDVSEHGLRRFARVLVADDARDPLEYREDVDPKLRESLGFGPALELPPPPEPPRSRLRSAIRLVALAHEPERADAQRFDRWVPTPGELDVYLPRMRALLLAAGERVPLLARLSPEQHAIYRWSLLATAWKETCWRHWVRKRRQIVPIRSPSGSVGLLQVNPRVWHGFYDVRALESDVSYNARAGAEILAHYLVDHAIRRGEHTATGDADNLARSAYAMYNGGPSQLRRYRRASASRRVRAVDTSFYEKYRETKAGRELGVARCFGIS